jgi:hypothetical protein
MNTKQIFMCATFGLLSFSSASFAQSAPAAGYLSDYQYQVANVTADQAQSLMDNEFRNTQNASICANRANLWSFIMNKDESIEVGKVFIHFTAAGEANENKQWSYHVAPYVIVNGVETVLDGGFDVFKHQPVALSDWTNYFGKSPNCVVLDPTHNPAHLALEQNDLPNDQVTPLTYKKGGARQYPTPEGTTCYIRKVPMYYTFPIDVYGADLALSGQTEYSKYLRTSFDKDDVLDSCKQAIGFFQNLSTNCSKYLGFSK